MRQLPFFLIQFVLVQCEKFERTKGLRNGGCLPAQVSIRAGDGEQIVCPRKPYPNLRFEGIIFRLERTGKTLDAMATKRILAHTELSRDFANFETGL